MARVQQFNHKQIATCNVAADVKVEYR